MARAKNNGGKLAPVVEPPPTAEEESLAAEAPSDPLVDFFVDDTEAAANRGVALSDSTSAGALGSSTAELLAFWVGAEEYGVDIVQIQEIIKVPEITMVPRAPGAVLGIISLRGTVVAVLDLRTVLGMERQATSRSSRILVLRGDGEPVGLVVDRVSSVVRFDRDAIQPVPGTMKRQASDLLQGVAREEERMLIVLDLPAVIGAMEYVA
jgi:purine-binding chemotaxis protein CheW